MKITKVTPFLVDKFLLVRVYTDAAVKIQFICANSYAT